MKTTHEQSKKIHFANRMMERFAIDIHQVDLTSLSDEIENGVNAPLIILENGNSFHFVTIAGQEMVVLYDWSINYFLTPFRKSWVRQDENGTWEFVSRQTKKKVQGREKYLDYARKNDIDEKFVNKHKISRTFSKKGMSSTNINIK